MSHDKWYSKGEVLNDLGEVSGRYGGGGLRHVTDRPPALAAGDNDEMKELLRRYGRSRSITKNDEGPDLAYIADLISQARQYDNHIPDYSDAQATDITEPTALVVSKACRLDPNVPEFRPRTAPNSLGIPKEENTVIRKDNFKNIPDSSTNPVKDMNNDIEKAAEDLKKTIITPVENTVESKLKRNAALMSLMRLYATQSPVPLQETLVQNTTEVKHPIVVKPKVAEKQIDEVSPQQIEDSIRKVDSWLSGPVKETIPEMKPKTPYTAQLKPFTYKKREKSSTSGCETPKSGASSTSAQSPASGSKKYVPSKNAQELYQQFEKQREKQLIEEAGDKTLWGFIQKGMYENKYKKN